jgi:two-component system cell cycle sensor histidine kinase/response regulator CckA
MKLQGDAKDKPSAEEQLLIYAEQVRQLYQNATVGMVGTVINSAALTYVIWNVVPHQAAIAWLVSLFLVTLFRAVQIFRYKRTAVPPADARRWGRWFIAGMALSGATWGAAGFFLFPSESTIHQALLFFVIGGMVAGAAGTFSVIRAVFLVYSIPALAPLIIHCFVIGDEIHIAMGGMALLFAVLLNWVSKSVHATAVTSLQLHFENSNLISYLGSAKEHAEKLNTELLFEIAEHKKAEVELKKHRENLEELVEERTTVWISATTQLQKEVTERRKAEESLRKSEEYFRSIIDNTLDLITVIDGEGIILFESPSLERLLGYGRKELIGKNVFEVVHPDDHAATKEALVRRIKEPGISETIEVRIRHANGSWRDFEAVGKSIVDESNVPRIIVNSRDKSERKKHEEDILKAQKLESLGTLAGGIAHDFNNLLTGILANIEMAKLRVKRDDESYSIMKKAEQAAIRASDLTHQLLTFSEGGAPVKKPVFIGDMVKAAVRFALRGSKAKCNVTIRNDLNPVEADEGQLRQVIHNIVLNAEQAMPQGGVITVRGEHASLEKDEVPSLPAGEYVKISIQDPGIGIPREHHIKIFDPYFTTKQKGSGLGLAAAYSIIKRHNGAITVESASGRGTTFTLYLPVFRKEFKVPGGRTDGLVFGSGRVLVMDDEEIIRDAAGLILKTAGYEVQLAHDGNEAIEYYCRAAESGKPFDVVVLDVTVPGGIGGRETVKKLREKYPDVRAIVSSGYSHDPIMANYKDYGFLGVIAKPYRPLDMSDVVKRVMTMDPRIS